MNGWNLASFTLCYAMFYLRAYLLTATAATALAFDAVALFYGNGSTTFGIGIFV
jgi:hypothetical protein